MTGLAELKRLAEAAVKRPWPSKAATSFAVTIDPATILSLIQRVEEAEAALKQQDEDQSEMLLIAHLNGAADLKDWKKRALKAESDAAFLNELTATPINILQERSHEEGRLAGIEEAAKLLDQAEASAMLDYGVSLADVQKALSSEAQAIRALKEKA